jgi:ABC-2 type transport system ATP-binding protein
LEAIVGALPIDCGGVSYDERLLLRLQDRARVFAFMPDATEPPPEVRVATFIDAVQGRAEKAGTDELVERLALKPLLRARVGELSRGEKRRLMLFAALYRNRPVAVLDEPLGVFDPLQLLDVLELLRQRARAGASFVMSIHQLADAEKIAERFVVLDGGRVLASGSLSELRDRVRCPDASLETVFLRLLRMSATDAAA